MPTKLLRALSAASFDFVPQIKALLDQPQLKVMITEAYERAVVDATLPMYLDHLAAVALAFEPIHVALDGLSFPASASWPDIVAHATSDYPGLADHHVEWRQVCVGKFGCADHLHPLPGLAPAMTRQLADAGLPPDFLERSTFYRAVSVDTPAKAARARDEIMACYRNGWPRELLRWLLVSDATLYLADHVCAPLKKRPVPFYLRVGDKVPAVSPSSTDAIAHVLPFDYDDALTNAGSVILLGENAPRIVMAKGFHPFLVQEFHNATWHTDTGCVTRPDAETVEAEIVASGGTARIVDQLDEWATLLRESDI